MSNAARLPRAARSGSRPRCRRPGLQLLLLLRVFLFQLLRLLRMLLLHLLLLFLVGLLGYLLILFILLRLQFLVLLVLLIDQFLLLVLIFLVGAVIARAGSWLHRVRLQIARVGGIGARGRGSFRPVSPAAGAPERLGAG